MSTRAPQADDPTTNVRCSCGELICLLDSNEQIVRKGGKDRAFMCQDCGKITTLRIKTDE